MRVNGAKPARRSDDTVPYVHFIFPGGERRTVAGPWVFAAFKPRKTKVTDEDNGARYVVIEVDANALEVTLASITKTVLSFAGEDLELK